MRINMSNQTSSEMPFYEMMKNEAERYASFKNKILLLGLKETVKDISEKLGAVVSFADNVTDPPMNIEVLGFIDTLGKKVFFVAGSKRANISWSDAVPSLDNTSVLVHLGNKLDWKVIKYNQNWSVIASGKKPEIELEKISASILA